MMILGILVGLALLFLGRQLFWLFVGGVGFAAGMVLATSLFAGQSEWWVLIAAVAAGIIGALLAVLLQRLAIGVAGFLAGGYLLLNLAQRVGREDWIWIAFILGGVIGAVLVTVLFDWALIGLSSLTGAVLVVESVRMEASIEFIAFAVLLVAGVAVQAARFRGQRPRATARPAG